MKFTKLTILAMLLALLVCAVVACGGGTDTEAPDTNAPDTQTPDTQAPDTDPVETEHVHEIENQITEPTCQERGYNREICKTCGDVVSVKPIEMIDHEPKEAATCTTAAVCKYCETEITAALGHSFGEATVTKAATCEAEGESTSTCTACGEKITEVVAKVAHNIPNPTESKAATIAEAGFTKGVCTICNKEVTVDIAAGALDTFTGLADGVVTPEAFAAASPMASAFTVVSNGGTLEAVTENGNTYIKKPGANDQLRYKETSVFMAASKVAFSFDFRLDADFSGLCGLFSVMNGGKEMRILNIHKNGLYFGINQNGIVKIGSLEVGKWINVKLIIDVTTYDYEIYVDGEKVMYTTADPDNAGMHLVYVLTDGEFAVTAPSSNETLHNGADRSPFVPAGTMINQFYFWHYSTNLACSLDNVGVSILG